MPPLFQSSPKQQLKKTRSRGSLGQGPGGQGWGLYIVLGLLFAGGLFVGIRFIKGAHTVRSTAHQTVQQQPIAAKASSAMAKRIVVVGGGLAGCTATLAAHSTLNDLDRADGVEVVLVDKMARLGGNSAKASSGINALNPPAGDSQQLFESDTEKSGGGLSKKELVSTLVVSAEKDKNVDVSRRFCHREAAQEVVAPPSGAVRARERQSQEQIRLWFGILSMQTSLHAVYVHSISLHDTRTGRERLVKQTRMQAQAWSPFQQHLMRTPAPLFPLRLARPMQSSSLRVWASACPRSHA